MARGKKHKSDEKKIPKIDTSRLAGGKWNTKSEKIQNLEKEKDKKTNKIPKINTSSIPGKKDKNERYQSSILHTRLAGGGQRWEESSSAGQLARQGAYAHGDRNLFLTIKAGLFRLK